MNDSWLVLLGLFLIIFELLFGAISGLDLALIGFSLTLGGIAHYFSGSWQSGIIVAVIINLAYFAYFRQFLRRKLLLRIQKIGIDTLLGKTAIVIEPIFANKAGKVLLDGEVYQAIGKGSFKTNVEVVVEKIEGISLLVDRLQRPK